MSTTVDVTDLTDAALDVVLAVRSGEDFVDCGHLTQAERLQVTEALGCENNARTRTFVFGLSEDVPRRRVHYIDHEALILARQDVEQNGEY